LKERKSTIDLPKKGHIYSFSTVVNAPDGFELQAPYTIALIELENGLKVTAQLTDFACDEKPEIGMEVEMTTRKLKEDGPRGIIVYGYKFRKPIR
jgi:hypothetical protein